MKKLVFVQTKVGKGFCNQKVKTMIIKLKCNRMRFVSQLLICIIMPGYEICVSN